MGRSGLAQPKAQYASVLVALLKPFLVVLVHTGAARQRLGQVLLQHGSEASVPGDSGHLLVDHITLGPLNSQGVPRIDGLELANIEPVLNVLLTLSDQGKVDSLRSSLATARRAHPYCTQQS